MTSPGGQDVNPAQTDRETRKGETAEGLFSVLPLLRTSAIVAAQASPLLWQRITQRF
jgi:hypothetical protein